MKLIKDWNEYLKLHTENNLIKIILFFPIFFHNSGMIFSLFYRIENFLYSNKYLKFIAYILYPIYFLITYYILDIDIHPSVKIGAGIYIHNKGIIIANNTEIGDFAKIIGPITIGANFNKQGSAKIGNNVTISTGSRIIGPVIIGDNVIIGANAVVVKNFESNCILGGVPANIIRKI